jgi:S1-C subfamily serine protease
MSSLDLRDISRSVVKLRAEVPEDAFTAGILGSERTGNGVIISADGLILTIGYLVTEATDVWLTPADGREVAGHALAYDQVTGFGLVLPLEKPALPAIPFGSSASLGVGDEAYVLSYQQFAKPHTVRILALREFAGAWEYLLETGIFTAPAHPHWSGAALVDGRGGLVGLGSLLVRESIAGEEINANMFVPIDLLKPILRDLITRGRATRQSRPWLGVYAMEVTDKVYVTGVIDGGPAQSADLREGDLIAQVADHDVSGLPDFYRRVWAVGPSGSGVPLTVIRGGSRLHLTVKSVDRAELLKRPQAH